MKQIIATTLLLLMAGMGTKAQDHDAASIEQIVTSRNFVFKAQFASPLFGAPRNLTSEYDLVVTIDTVTAWLPYFGRAYSAPINSMEGGIKFNSIKFVYTQQKKKKGNWEIVIKPHDAPEIQQLYLTVQENGAATLSVNSLNRQSISFSGYIVAGKPRDKKAF